jgi:hypothetical protein
VVHLGGLGFLLNGYMRLLEVQGDETLLRTVLLLRRLGLLLALPLQEYLLQQEFYGVCSRPHDALSTREVGVHPPQVT